MNEITAKTEDDILVEVSDEALEAAAGTAGELLNFTLGSCTGLSECPACSTPTWSESAALP